MVIDCTMADQLMHDRVVREVAAERFSLDDWEVTTNFAADGGSPGDIGPDITAMHGASVVAVGEVETVGTVCEERARHWKMLGEECVRFYLYVPEGAEEEAVRLISEHEIACAGLRSYSCNGRVGTKPVHVETAHARDDDHPWWMVIGKTDKD